MWIKAGPRYFNTDAIAYVQVAYEDNGKDLRAVYLHFLSDSHTFTLHGEEATHVFASLEAVAFNADQPATVLQHA